MKTITKDGVTTVVAQNEVIIPDLTIKDLLSAIPLVASHCSFVDPPADLSSLCGCGDLVLTAISGRHSALGFTCKQLHHDART